MERFVLSSLLILCTACTIVPQTFTAAERPAADGLILSVTCTQDLLLDGELIPVHPERCSWRQWSGHNAPGAAEHLFTVQVGDDHLGKVAGAEIKAVLRQHDARP